MAMAFSRISTTTPSQFQLHGITKFCVGRSSGYASMKLSSLNFQTSNSFLFTSPQTQGRDFGRKKIVFEVGSGLEVSIEDSEDAITVKKVQIVVESQDSDKIQVRVDLPGGETQRVFDKVLTNLARTAPPIPGFRREKGGKTTKVPKSFLLGVVGEERVTKFVLKEIISSSIAQYVKQENLKVKEDKINTTESAEELKASFRPGRDFGFCAIIELSQSDETASEVDSDVDSEVEVPA